MFWRAEQELASESPAASQDGLRQKLKEEQPSRNPELLSAPILLSWISRQQHPSARSQESTAHSHLWILSVPPQNWCFLLWTVSFAFLYCKRYVFLLLLFCPSQPIFFFFVPSSFKYICVISYLYDSAQRCKWKAKPWYAGHFSVVRGRPHPYDVTG